MEVPYGKLTIYTLIFITSAYSCYGSGILGDLRDAVTTAQSIFQNLLQNVVTIANKLKNVHDVFDAAVEEHCVFKCPSGATPKPNKNHIPKSNGCGSLGLQIDHQYLPIGAMTKCCDLHDICYDTCNSDKEVCDMEFRKCLYNYCKNYENTVGGSTLVKACKAAAKVLFTGTLTLGCKCYIDAQTKACYCPPAKKDYSYKYTRGDGEL